jgi:hypothetical protein
MDGRRFGVGIAAGLLFGFAVITAAGGLGSLSTASFYPVQGGLTAITTSSATATVTQSSTVTRTANASIPAYVASGNLTNLSTSTTGATPNSAVSNAGLKNAASSAANGASPSFSSRIQSIAAQPLSSDAVVIIPALLALLLGALLYRASNRSGKQPGEESP